MTTEAKTRIINRLEAVFSGPGRAAAVNEVLTCERYPEYLSGILAQAGGENEEAALLAWATRRGQIWE